MLQLAEVQNTTDYRESRIQLGPDINVCTLYSLDYGLSLLLFLVAVMRQLVAVMRQMVAVMRQMVAVMRQLVAVIQRRRGVW